ncbi:hypothetical protein [Rhizobium sp. SG741]|uniref:hypothetical protein n=1 Tax=Rhizobium sp. SG741 TaxID=2587114 RepID=UPI0014455E6B|nr:hypothetical protein [Rhizobium sp. SG741]NKJ03816.1 hypothetical protein [Rhizobium sp. SG741]
MSALSPGDISFNDLPVMTAIHSCASRRAGALLAILSVLWGQFGRVRPSSTQLVIEEDARKAAIHAKMTTETCVT